MRTVTLLLVLVSTSTIACAPESVQIELPPEAALLMAAMQPQQQTGSRREEPATLAPPESIEVPVVKPDVVPSDDETEDDLVEEPAPTEIALPEPDNVPEPTASCDIPPVVRIAHSVNLKMGMERVRPIFSFEVDSPGCPLRATFIAIRLRRMDPAFLAGRDVCAVLDCDSLEVVHIGESGIEQPLRVAHVDDEVFVGVPTHSTALLSGRRPTGVYLFHGDHVEIRGRLRSDYEPGRYRFDLDELNVWAAEPRTGVLGREYLMRFLPILGPEFVSERRD